jgi:hypothetical protein
MECSNLGIQHTLRNFTWGVSTGSIQLPDTGSMHASRFNHTLNPATASTPDITSLDSTHPFLQPPAAIRPQHPVPRPDTRSTLCGSSVSHTLHRCAALTLQRRATLALMTSATPRKRVLPPHHHTFQQRTNRLYRSTNLARNPADQTPKPTRTQSKHPPDPPTRPRIRLPEHN